MKILEFLKELWEKRDKIKNISNTIIRVIDAMDGVKDWELKEKK